MAVVLQTKGPVEPRAGRGIPRPIPLTARRLAALHRPVPVRRDRQASGEGITRLVMTPFLTS